MATGKRSTKADNDFADRTFRNLDKEKVPLLTIEDLEAIDRRLYTADVRSRRGALLVLTRTFKDYADACVKDRQLAVDMAMLSHFAKESAEFHRGLADLLETACTRMLVGLCGRKDMQEVLEEGKAAHLSSEEEEAPLHAR